MDLDPENVIRSPLFLGAIGSAISLKYVPGKTWPESAFNLAAGTAFSWVMSPAAAEWMRITSAGMQSAMAFGAGIFGLSLCAASIEGIRSLKLAEIITGWVSRKG